MQWCFALMTSDANRKTELDCLWYVGGRVNLRCGRRRHTVIKCVPLPFDDDEAQFLAVQRSAARRRLSAPWPLPPSAECCVLCAACCAVLCDMTEFFYSPVAAVAVTGLAQHRLTVEPASQTQDCRVRTSSAARVRTRPL